ncbi:MAG: ABC transporter permease, partial [Sphingomonadaceae bacterium]|nr:ABC transporter permease [Sphingomonadaceae bacterium]
MILSRFERMIARRYLLPGKGEGFIFLVAGISLTAVMLGVAALIIVMSVMNGFRAELFEKIVGLNGHAVVQGYGGRLADWRAVMAQAKATPGVISATPLIEQPLLANFNGRVEAVLVRGMTMADIGGNATLKGKIKIGSLSNLAPGRNVIAIGSGLANNLGVTVGNTVSIINPAGRTTPFGTVPREIGYEVGAVFEVGVYDYDKAFVIMPMDNAQQLLLLGDSVGMIEVTTTDPDNVATILAPLADKVEGRAVITDWRQMNSSLFEALQVDRIVSFVVLSLIILVAVFNILSSLIMLVRAKTRDIAIMRTMGARRSSLLKIFVTVGVTVGSLGMAAGVVLGFVFLFFREQVVGF